MFYSGKHNSRNKVEIVSDCFSSYFILLSICGIFNYCYSQGPDCASATPIPYNDTCVPLAFSVSNGWSGTPESSCAWAGTNDDGWFSFTATLPESVIEVFNSSQNTVVELYSGTCSNLTLLDCTASSSSPKSVSAFTTVGETYYVRIIRTNNGGGSTTGEICAHGAPFNCANAVNQTEDFCEFAVPLTQGNASYCGQTAATYTQDEPGDMQTYFTGSIENNSWFSFIANATTQSFDFDVSNCNGNGIQAQVYDVTYVGNCCAYFTPMSVCWNPGAAVNYTLEATGLTIGQEYILMVDGYAGANCDWCINGWGAIALPVELVSFTGDALPSGNELQWQTASENENDYFEVFRKSDGGEFESVGIVDGSGNSQELNHYNFLDPDPRMGIDYYMLKQVNYDGNISESEVIIIDRNRETDEFIYVWPNPSYGTIQISSKEKLDGFIELKDNLGRVVYSYQVAESISNVFRLDLNIIPHGIYMITYTSKTGMSQSKKIIKH